MGDAVNLEILLGFVMATATLALSPGPDNIYVLTQSLAHGSKSGLATVAGLMTGCIVHTTLVAFGVATLIKLNPTLFWVIKLLGAVYLLYLAYQVYREPGDIQLRAVSGPKKSAWQQFKRGFVMNLLNPKVAIFFLAFFPGFLFSNSIGTVIQFYVLGLLFILVSFVVFGGIALLSGSVAHYAQDHPRIGIYLKYMQLLVLVGIALYLVFSG